MKFPLVVFVKLLALLTWGFYTISTSRSFCSTKNIIINFNWSRKNMFFFSFTFFHFRGTKNPNYNETENVTKHVSTTYSWKLLQQQ